MILLTNQQVVLMGVKKNAFHGKVYKFQQQKPYDFVISTLVILNVKEIKIICIWHRLEADQFL